MGKRIYASIPVNYTDREDLISNIKIKLIDLNGALKQPDQVSFCFWREGQRYNTSLVEDSDVFLFTHQDNKFEFNVLSLPIGVANELHLARKWKKKILLMYVSRMDVLGLYDIDHALLERDGTIKGKSGTSSALFNYIEDSKKGVTNNKQLTEWYECSGIDRIVEVPKEGTFDRRILLIL